MRLMAIDGFVLDLPDTPDNARIFGRPESGRATGAFPRARVLSLCEVGTRASYEHLVGPIRCGEVAVADYLLRALEEDMLLLWDRNFLSHENSKQVRRRGAHLLARIGSDPIFVPAKVLPDGSYLAKMYRSCWDRKCDRDGIVVRIVEYTSTDPGRAGDGTVHRLLTPLPDATTHPAKDLVVLHRERWEHEGTIDESKTHQLVRPVLRSETPAGVIQEIEGLMLAHYAVRTLVSEAATRAGLEPRKSSFAATLKILRCRPPEVRAGEAGRRRRWAGLLAEVGEAILEPRRHRANPRVIERKMSEWLKKRPHHRQTPQPSMPFRDSIQIEWNEPSRGETGV